MIRNKIVEIVSLLLIVLFVYAGVSKFLDYEKFVVQISQSPMLTNFSGFIGWFIPLIEMAVAGLLIFERTRLVGLYASFSLMMMFTTYIILASRFSDYVPCSCGGIIQDLTWNEHFVFNLFFVIGSLVAILIHFLPDKRQTTYTFKNFT